MTVNREDDSVANDYGLEQQRQSIRIMAGYNSAIGEVREIGVDANGRMSTGLTNDDGTNVSAINPLTVSDGWVYANMIDVANSSNGGFGGDVLDYFNDLSTVNEDVSATNPKTIKIQFYRPIELSAIGFGCDDLGKDFSNVTVELLGSGDVVRATLGDAADNTKRNSFVVRTSPSFANAINIKFNTADPIGLSNIGISSIRETISTIQGEKPDGTLTPIGATVNDNLRVSVQEYGDTPSIDAFGKLRVTNPFTVFDSKQLHDKQPLFWDEEVGGSATSTHNAVDADTEMVVTANSADYVIRQTKQRFNYQPGKSQLINMTYVAPQTTGLIKRIGMFDGTGVNNLDPNNGIFFETNGDLSWNICKNGTITETVTQANWNVDKLDGTGPSGITLDPNATQILLIDFEWLGVGRVRVGFVIDGLVYYTHYFNHANDSTFNSVYMSTPNLPLRYSIETDGTVGGQLNHICSTVISEGGLEKTGILRVADTGFTHIDASTANTTYAIVGIRLKDTYKDISVIPESISLINENNDDFRWSLHLNPTVAGTFTYTGLTDSSVETAVGATANTLPVDSGIVLASGYASIETQQTNTSLKTALRIGSTIAGVQDELVLAVTPLSPGADIQGAINFRELL